MDTAEHRRAWAVAAAVVVFFGLAGVYAWVQHPEDGSALDQLGPWTGAVGLVLALVGTAWVWWPALRPPPPRPPSGKIHDERDEPRLLLHPALPPRLFTAVTVEIGPRSRRMTAPGWARRADAWGLMLR